MGLNSNSLKNDALVIQNYDEHKNAGFTSQNDSNIFNLALP